MATLLLVRKGGLLILLAATLAWLGAGAVLADSGGGGAPGATAADPRYAKAVALIETERYAQAIEQLERFIADQPGSADGHNLLGYATRKLGRPADALAHYREALRLDPKHRGAHEYIGEAYLQLGQLDKAKEHLAFLDDDCWLPCAEYSDLKEAIARYEAAQRR